MCKSLRFTWQQPSPKKRRIFFGFRCIFFHILCSQWSNAKRAQKLNSTNSMKLIRILSTTQHKILRFRVYFCFDLILQPNVFGCVYFAWISCTFAPLFLMYNARNGICMNWMRSALILWTLNTASAKDIMNEAMESEQKLWRLTELLVWIEKKREAIHEALIFWNVCIDANAVQLMYVSRFHSLDLLFSSKYNGNTFEWVVLFDYQHLIETLMFVMRIKYTVDRQWKAFNVLMQVERIVFVWNTRINDKWCYCVIRDELRQSERISSSHALPHYGNNKELCNSTRLNWYLNCVLQRSFLHINNCIKACARATMLQFLMRKL